MNINDYENVAEGGLILLVLIVLLLPIVLVYQLWRLATSD